MPASVPLVTLTMARANALGSAHLRRRQVKLLTRFCYAMPGNDVGPGPGQEADAVLYLRATAQEFVVVEHEFDSSLLDYLTGLTPAPWAREDTDTWVAGHDTLPISAASACYLPQTEDGYLAQKGRVKVLQSDHQVGCHFCV